MTKCCSHIDEKGYQKFWLHQINPLHRWNSHNFSSFYKQNKNVQKQNTRKQQPRTKSKRRPNQWRTRKKRNKGKNKILKCVCASLPYRRAFKKGNDNNTNPPNPIEYARYSCKKKFVNRQKHKTKQSQV